MTELTPKPAETTRLADKFVSYIITRIAKDTGAAAALKRADNPALEYQSWEHLAQFIDIDKDFIRLPYATIAAAIAKAKAEHNGNVRIGAAIARCYDDGIHNDQAQAKLRRLLACESVDEACRVLRPLFSLITAKASIHLDYADLLQDLSWFHTNNPRVKAKWAQNFYRQTDTEEDGQ